MGGGAMEMEMAKAVMEAAAKTEGKHALAMEAFATAMTQIPTILADNAGYGAAELVSQLKVAHSTGNAAAGLDMNAGVVGDRAEALSSRLSKPGNSARQRRDQNPRTALDLRKAISPRLVQPPRTRPHLRN